MVSDMPVNIYIAGDQSKNMGKAYLYRVKIEAVLKLITTLVNTYQPLKIIDT